MERQGIVYCLTSPSGKRYVGKTVQALEKRLRQHGDQARRGVGSPLCCAIRKYGLNAFDLNVVWRSGEQELLDKESELVSLMGCIAPRGYNAKGGGGEAFTFSQETRRKMSAAKRGRPIPHLTSEQLVEQGKTAFLGKHHTEEAKAKMRAAKLGKKLSVEHRRKMSKTHKLRWADPESRARLDRMRSARPSCVKEKKFKFSEEHRRKISEARRRSLETEEGQAQLERALDGARRAREARNG